MSYVYITEDDAKLYKRGGRYILGRNKEIVMEVPEEILEALVLVGRVQVSSEAMTSLLEHNIPVTWMSKYGKFCGRLESTLNVNVVRQYRQAVLQESEYFLKLGKRLIEAKAHNQLVILRRYNRRAALSSVQFAIEDIQSHIRRIFKAESREEIMGHEGNISKIYFQALGKLVPEDFSFAKRSRRPPLDEFNSLLSFGYTLLTYDMYTAIANHGLSPYFGILHAMKNHHPALASDLIEEWRPTIIDSMVLGLIHHREITKAHFHLKEGKDGIYLNREGRNIFIHAYEKKMRTINKYGDDKNSYREYINKQVDKFSQSLMTGKDLYAPIILR